MNLHNIANRAITRVNPNITATVREYLGFTVGEGRTRQPNYAPDREVILQLQPVTRGELQHIDGLNLQALYKSIHINGNYYSVQREKRKGGDLFIINGETWLVVQPLELWPDWSRLLVVLQTDPIMPRVRNV